jgi:hypothetical protein
MVGRLHGFAGLTAGLSSDGAGVGASGERALSPDTGVPGAGVGIVRATGEAQEDSNSIAVTTTAVSPQARL